MERERRVDDARATLLEALRHGHRLAKDAHAAERERYWNSQGAIALGGLMVWFLLFLGLGLAFPDPNFVARMTSSFAASSLLSVAFTAPILWMNRRRFVLRLARLEPWVRRLEETLARESGREVPEVGGASSFEFLAEASREVPAWIDSVRRVGLSRDVGTWGLLFLLVWLGVEALAIYVPSVVGQSLLAGVLLGSAGLALLAVAYVIYRRWAQRRDAILARERAAWERRRGALEERMVRYLEEL